MDVGFWVCMTTSETARKLSSTVSKVLGSHRLSPKNCPMKTRLPIWIRKCFFYVKLTGPLCSYCFKLETYYLPCCITWSNYCIHKCINFVSVSNLWQFQVIWFKISINYPLKTALWPNLSHFFGPKFFPTL